MDTYMYTSLHDERKKERHLGQRLRGRDAWVCVCVRECVCLCVFVCLRAYRHA